MPAAVPGAIALGLCEVTMTITALSINAVVYPSVGRLTQKAEKRLRGVETVSHTTREQLSCVSLGGSVYCQAVSDSISSNSPGCTLKNLQHL